MVRVINISRQSYSCRITKKHGDDIDITSYGVGDTIIVNCPRTGYSHIEEYRVKKRTVDIDKTGTSSFT